MAGHKLNLEGKYMLQRQKETIMKVLKERDAKRDYGGSRYWFFYKDFLDPTDPFTDFACENLEGKQAYIAMVESLLRADTDAKVYVEVYGFEEVKEEPFIYADTLIVFSRLTLPEIERIFNEPQDIFPDDIGEETDFSRQNYVIDENGNLLPVPECVDGKYSVYYCWWD